MRFKNTFFLLAVVATLLMTPAFIFASTTMTSASPPVAANFQLTSTTQLVPSFTHVAVSPPITVADADLVNATIFAQQKTMMQASQVTVSSGKLSAIINVEVTQAKLPILTAAVTGESNQSIQRDTKGIKSEDVMLKIPYLAGAFSATQTAVMTKMMSRFEWTQARILT